MFFGALSFTIDYVSKLADELNERYPDQPISNIQQKWLSFCITGLLLTNTLSWAAFERMGLGTYRVAALSWMFRNSPLYWSKLLEVSTALILRLLKLRHGVLVIDDTDHQRAKTTKRIYGTHKIFDKKTKGYFNGQCLVVLLLVTEKITLPVGFAFHRPDPVYSAWQKENKRLIKAKIKSDQRPEAPKPDPDYPGKKQIALTLIGLFHCNHTEVIIKAILADAAFGTKSFMESACIKAGCKQIISQLCNDQLVKYRNKWMTLKKYFTVYSATTQAISVRGGETNIMMVGSARLFVKAHNEKRFVIAVKNESESEYRYLVATDLTWRTQDIVQCYTLRWLVEVFFEDWKLYEGWTGMAKQPDEEGSFRGVILSLLLDHALLIHPEQRACLENKTPAYTVGSLKRAAQAETIVEFVRKIALDTNPLSKIEQLAEKIKLLFPLDPSKKHMSSRDLGRQEPTPSLCRYASSKVEMMFEPA